MSMFWLRRQWQLVGGVLTVLVVILFVVLRLFKNEPAPVEEFVLPPEPVIEEVKEEVERNEVIGSSVEGRPIEVYRFGEGDTHILFVGGVHGGYEWNSVLLSYELIDWLTEDVSVVPENLQVSVIPSLNPDGVVSVVGVEGRFAATDVPQNEGPLGNGRFNANGVDLNRNFDCKWQPESMWRGNVVSAGTEAFSEPEAVTLRNFVASDTPVAVVFYHSQANAVYASECEDGILAGTLDLMQTYADAAGYPSVDTFDAYSVTGDAEGWLASIGIPAVTVELSSHTSVEWEKNKKGVEALFASYESDPEIGL